MESQVKRMVHLQIEVHSMTKFIIVVKGQPAIHVASYGRLNSLLERFGRKCAAENTVVHTSFIPYQWENAA